MLRLGALALILVGKAYNSANTCLPGLGRGGGQIYWRPGRTSSPDITLDYSKPSAGARIMLYIPFSSSLQKLITLNQNIYTLASNKGFVFTFARKPSPFPIKPILINSEFGISLS